MFVERDPTPENRMVAGLHLERGRLLLDNERLTADLAEQRLQVESLLRANAALSDGWLSATRRARDAEERLAVCQGLLRRGDGAADEAREAEEAENDVLEQEGF